MQYLPEPSVAQAHSVVHVVLLVTVVVALVALLLVKWAAVLLSEGSAQVPTSLYVLPPQVTALNP